MCSTLPTPVPQQGQPGGPPAPTGRKILWGMPLDLRSFAVSVERHPERMAAEMEEMGTEMQQMMQDQRAGKNNLVLLRFSHPLNTDNKEPSSIGCSFVAKSVALGKGDAGL